MTADIGIYLLGLVSGMILHVAYADAKAADTLYENTERSPLITPIPNTYSTLTTTDTSEARKNAKRIAALNAEERMEQVTAIQLSAEAQRMTSCGCYDDDAKEAA